jgi:hypothetical protein
MDYKKQAEDFCEKFGVNIKIEKSAFQSPPMWAEEGKKHGIKYEVTISREGRKDFKFNFWGSIADAEGLNESYGRAREKFLPSVYDVLACITKNDPEAFEDFCGEFGYNTDSIKALQTFNAVDKEFHEVKRMFADCLEELQEIN